MADLNAISIGIDSGSRTSKAAYHDKSGTRITTRLEGFDVNVIREESEINLEQIITGCVIVLPDEYTRRQREDVITKASGSGFDQDKIEIISIYEAMNWGLELDADSSALICDLGASRITMAVIGNDELIDTETITDFHGNEMDKIFASWLCDRFSLNLIDEKLLRQRAEQIKITLSLSDIITWRGVEIHREDLERLLYFPVKRITHYAGRLARIHKPDKIILTGGLSNIPIVSKIFAENIRIAPEIDADLIVKGAAMKASEAASQSSDSQYNHEALSQRLRELRASVIEIEQELTRAQKDKLYLLFRQAEGINDSRIIKLMEGMINEIKQAV